MSCKVLIYCLFIAVSSDAFGQGQSIKIGELNSYKVFHAFLEPYRKGWQLALEEINRSGGVLGRQVEVVSRDDGGTPGDAVRVAEELISREKADVLMGTRTAPSAPPPSPASSTPGRRALHRRACRRRRATPPRPGGRARRRSG